MILYLILIKIIIGEKHDRFNKWENFFEDGYEIREYYTEHGLVHAFILNNCIQSIIYVDEDKINNLCLDYFNFYNIPMEVNPNGTDYLMLVGGGISYPHYYLNKYKNKIIDIVEIDNNCIEYDKKYFYLDKLIEKSEKRLNIFIDDATKCISNTNKKYDYILIDLFKGRNHIKNIYDNENIINLKRIVKPDGIIIIKYIIENSNLDRVINKISKISNYYKIIASEKYFNTTYKIGNILIILSNEKIIISKSYNYIEIK